MRVVETILIVVSALCQLGGVVLVVRGILAARDQLDTPVPHILDGGSPGDNHIYPPRINTDTPEVFLLQAMERQGAAVALLVVGIVTGMAAGLMGVWGG